VVGQNDPCWHVTGWGGGGRITKVFVR
jgi:hypothetical protein